jgi:hypothetical protein
MTTENTVQLVTVESVAQKAVEARPAFFFDAVKNWHYAKADVPADVALWELLDNHSLSELMGK